MLGAASFCMSSGSCGPIIACCPSAESSTAASAGFGALGDGFMRAKLAIRFSITPALIANSTKGI